MTFQANDGRVRYGRANHGRAVYGVVVSAVLVLGMFLVPAWSADAQPIFETEEFRINVDQTGPQSNPNASFHRSGRFVSVWESELRGVVARFFNRDRSPMGPDVVLQANDPIGPLPFRGNIKVQKDAVVAMTQGQTFLLFWTEEEQRVSIDIFFESRIATSRLLYGQAFNLNGNALGDRFRIGQDDTGRESRPAVALDGSGDVTVVWTRSFTGASEVFARRIAGNGEAMGDEFRVDQGAGSTDASRASAASLADGTSLVVWEACCDGGGAGGELGIFGRFFDAQGTALSDAFQINATIEGNQRVPVTVGEDGRFLVAWQGPTGEVQEDGEIFRIYGRGVTLDDGVSGEETILSSGPQRAHSSPAMAVGIEGDVVLVWMGWIENFRVGVFGTRLSLEGEQVEAKTEAFKISQNTIGGQFRLGLSATPLGRFLAAWEGFGDDGNLRIAARLVLPGSEVECIDGAGSLTTKTPGASLCN